MTWLSRNVWAPTASFQSKLCPEIELTSFIYFALHLHSHTLMFNWSCSDIFCSYHVTARPRCKNTLCDLIKPTLALPPTQVSPRSTECRRKQDECDLAEYCDGQSPICPEDVFGVNGLPCGADLGYCFDGRCPQRVNQCGKMFGGGERPVIRSCNLFK